METGHKTEPEKVQKHSLSGRTLQRILPYIWRHRWLVLLTFLLMWVYSLGVNCRNLIPALFFDGVLLSDSTGPESVLSSFVRPITESLGFVDQTKETSLKIEGAFRDLTILEWAEGPGEKAIQEARFTVKNGRASFQLVRPKPEPEDRLPLTFDFTELTVHCQPGEFQWDPTQEVQRIPSGNLNLQDKPALDPTKWGFLKFLLALGLAVCLVIAGSRFCQKYLEGYLIQHILADLRRDLIDHMSGLSLSFFDHRSRGDLLSRISTDLTVVTASLGIVFGDLIQKPITFLVALVVLFMIKWWLALIVLCFFPLLFFIIAKFGRKVRRRSRKQSSKRGVMTTALEQLFSGIRTVKSFRMEDFEKKHFEEKNLAVAREGVRTIAARVLSNSSVELAAHVGIIVALGVGGYFLLHGQLMGAGDLIAFIAAVNTMYMPVKAMAKAYATFQESIGAMERVTEIFESQPTVIEAPGAVPLKPFQSAIEFRDVSFSYGREAVLSDINISIPAGSLTAIVGPTGAGKSTLVDLILRFNDPTKGEILIDGVDIRTVTLESLLAQVSIVSQEPFLFDTTIRNNILYGQPEANQREIEEAARMANIHDFIVSLPDGYDTDIGDRGVMLSGGQRQRLTIARSLLKNSSILILDEATSSLDSESEAAVQDAIEKLIQVRSTIAIAHRLSTIRSADRILVLDRGRIIESGTYDELLKKGGLFSKLHATQFGVDGNGSG